MSNKVMTHSIGKSAEIVGGNIAVTTRNGKFVNRLTHFQDSDTSIGIFCQFRIITKRKRYKSLHAVRNEEKFGT